MAGYGSNTKRNLTVRTKDNWLLFSEANTYSGLRSPRVNGKLKLRMNAYNRTYVRKEFSPSQIGKTVWTGEALWRYVRVNKSDVLTQREIDNCILDFYNEVNGMATNLLDALRQRQKTVDMITSNLMKCYRSYSLLRKGKWKKAANALGVSPRGSPRGRDVPSRWLELQYGWLPLLGDIYIVGNQLFPTPKFRAKKSIYATASLSQINSYGSSTLDLVDRYSVIGYFEIKGATVPTMQHLGVLNPLAVAWEAVPFSFVVDWFLPVGDWISALTALSGVDMKQTSVVRCIKGERRGVVRANTPGITSSCYEQTYSYKRTTGLPQRPFPSFKNPLSIGHFANGMSLLATIFGRKK